MKLEKNNAQKTDEKKATLTVSIPHEVKLRIKIYALEHHTTVSDLFMKFAQKCFDEDDNKKEKE